MSLPKLPKHVGREHQLELWNIEIHVREAGSNQYVLKAILKNLRVHGRKELHGYCRQFAWANRDARCDWKFVSVKVDNIVGKVREDLDRPNNPSGPIQ